jgi:MFS family permease
MVFSVFPAFFVSVLHAGASSLGLVDGVAEGLSNLFKIYSGNLSDRMQKRKLLVTFGYTLSVLTRPLYVLAGSVGAVMGLRVTDRIGKGLRDSPRDSLISLSVPKEELGRAFGYHRAMDTTGAVLGPLVAYLILRLYPGQFNAVFLTAFFVGLLTILTLFFIVDVTMARGAQSRRVGLIKSFGVLPGGLKIYLAAVFLLSVGSLPVAVMLLKTTGIGLIIADIPLFYMLYGITYALFSTPAGRLSDKFGPRRVIFAGYLLLIAAYAVINLATAAWSLALGFLVFGLFPALTDGTQRAMAARLAPEEVRGGALGWLNAANGFGALLAGAGGGYLWQTSGPATAMFVGAAVIVAGLVLLFVSQRGQLAAGYKNR